MCNAAIQSLNECGQSVWLDGFNRPLLNSGKLKSLINEGVTGLTTDPSILLKSVLDNKEYREEIEVYCRSYNSYVVPGQGLFVPAIHDYIMVSDIRSACDLFLTVYNSTNHQEGYVSVCLDPANAYRYSYSVEQAKWIWNEINRPNLMIKVPATPVGMDIVRDLTYLGINTNATMIFDLEQYEHIVMSYTEGLLQRQRHNLSLESVQSVASVFVSRVDAVIDPLLIGLGWKDESFYNQSVLGYAGNANSKIIYDMFRILHEDKIFSELLNLGANPQRIVWSSVGVKNSEYEQLKYIKGLIGPDTISTIPFLTLDYLMKNKKQFQSTVTHDLPLAYDFMDKWLSPILEKDNKSFVEISTDIMNDGIWAFLVSYDEMISCIHAQFKK